MIRLADESRERRGRGSAACEAGRRAMCEVERTEWKPRATEDFPASGEGLCSGKLTGGVEISVCC